MNETGSINNRLAGLPSPIEREANEAARRRGPAKTEAASSQSDRVELSEAAANYDPEAVMDRRIADIRSQIANDTYLTPEKLDAVAEGLLKDIALL